MDTKFTKAHGSTNTGLSHWWAQRTTGVLLIPLTLWFIYLLATQEVYTYENMRALLNPLPTAIAFVLLVLSMSYHSYLGVQVALEDYVHQHSTLIICLFTSQTIHLVAALASLLAVVRINLGGS